MLELIQALLGLAFTASLVVLIKPTMIHKKLTRKKMLIGIGVILALIAITPIDQEAVARREAEEAAQQAERDAKEAERIAAEQDEAERERIEQEAEQALFDAITFTASIRQNSIGTPELHVNVTNGTEKTIDALVFETYFTNNFGDPVGKWDSRTSEAFRGEVQETIRPGSTLYNYEWNLALYESATKFSDIKALRVHFTDGTEILRK